jgi:hypothetical protein
MDYGEELAYWYLRLNGFFPITDFVIHKSKTIKHSSDCDLLALRAPSVYEEIGGRREDWDRGLADALDFENRFVGVICEVKTGAYEMKKLFKPDYLQYSVGRLGLVNGHDLQAVATKLAANDYVDGNGIRVAKLLITNGDKLRGPFLFRSVNEVEDFISHRVSKYPKEKYSDRHFFRSEMFQLMIHQVNRERLARNPHKGSKLRQVVKGRRPRRPLKRI